LSGKLHEWLKLVPCLGRDQYPSVHPFLWVIAVKLLTSLVGLNFRLMHSSISLGTRVIAITWVTGKYVSCFFYFHLVFFASWEIIQWYEGKSIVCHDGTHWMLHTWGFHGIQIGPNLACNFVAAMNCNLATDGNHMWMQAVEGRTW
jgi:hypothetical protein